MNIFSQNSSQMSGEGYPIVKFSEVESLAPDTSIHQIEDGTIFYAEEGLPSRLYAKWGGMEVHFNITAEISSVIAYGNAVYFVLDNQIYEATLSAGAKRLDPWSTIHQTRLQFEPVAAAASETGRDTSIDCAMTFKDGIPVGAFDRQLRVKGNELTCIHRGKAIFTTSNLKLNGRKLSDNILPDFVSTARDSSSSIYISHYSKHILYTCEADTMTFQPYLNDDIDKYGDDHVISSIVGIFKGEITVTVKEDPLYDVRVAMERLAKRNLDLQTKERELKEAMEAQKCEILTMQKIVNNKSKM
ncbi:hypothetical protein PRIPAC_87350 [Pristionchus pacificus]|uniref:Uncharacterized protein n=1 Tax=Pristionchus pacificus TaxID=54126 RepID=A0A2A6CXB4_PRIPA|nr:hypothetical protein PRIPAC_87350 [Pristionchus pacificus]|eukprot:PDM82671.1 hypothetical protein PRIPAC_37064 [Pristionchus pacificus]